jgi:hypothetical protein
MANRKQAEAKTEEGRQSSTSAPQTQADDSSKNLTGLLFQSLIGLACWMAVGLLLEGLLGYKAPAYLGDVQRRELFRLAHTHGTLLSLILAVVALIGKALIAPPLLAQRALRFGSVLMPVGFLLAGIWHPEGDPGLAIWLVPPGALLMIFGVVATALTIRRR